MKSKQLVNKLSNAFDSATKQRRKYQKKLESFLGQIQSEEQNIRLKLETEKSKTSRGKLKKELDTVKKAYATLLAA